MRRAVIFAVLPVILFCSAVAVAGSSACVRRPLRVVLYPFVPEKGDMFARIEAGFEALSPEVDLQIVDLSENYYNEDKKNAVTNTNADVYEIDSVFLQDFVENGRIQPLPASLEFPKQTFAPVAEAAVTFADKIYAVPHWLCTAYLFTLKSDPLSGAKTLDEVTAKIDKSQLQSKGLLIDLSGKSTLGEAYLDALLDRDRTLEKAAQHLSLATFDPGIASQLSEARSLCDSSMCRDGDYHDMVGLYARLFAHRRGRALAGYSERLHYIDVENRTACLRDECTKVSELAVTPLPLSANGSQPFAWVDSLAIDTGCKGQCAADAAMFIQFAASEELLKALLLPSPWEAARYLLPARTTLFKPLIDAMPIYGPMLDAMNGAIPVRGQGLNRQLRAIGAKLDAELPK